MASMLKAVLGISRAPFLLLPVTLILAGAAASAYEGSFSLLRSLFALAGLIALHIGVNAINEAGDSQSGIDLHTERTPFSGGSGTIPSGAASIWVACAFGLAMTLVGLGIGVGFLIVVGWILLPIVLLGAFAVLTYTHVLLRLGVGEIFAGLGLGALPVLGASLVQDGDLGPATISASVPAFFMTFNLLVLNEFPDEQADRQGGRRHLVILLGRRRAATIYVLAALFTTLSIVVFVSMQALPVWALAALLPTLLLLPALRWALTAPQQQVPIAGLAGNVIWNLATNLLLAGAFAIAALLQT